MSRDVLPRLRVGLVCNVMNGAGSKAAPRKLPLPCLPISSKLPLLFSRDFVNKGQGCHSNCDKP